MTIPFREWTLFDKTTLEAFYLIPPGTAALSSDWTVNHFAHLYIGDENLAGTRDYMWRTVFRPKAGQDFQSRDGMDEIMSVEFNHEIFLIQDTSNLTDFQLIHGFMDNNNAWEKNRVNGRYYDGVNGWDSYPPGQTFATQDYDTVIKSQLPKVYNPWFPAYKAASGAWANAYQADFWRGGAHFKASNYNPDAPAAGEIFQAGIFPHYLRVRFFNPVVNELSRAWAPTAGGVELVLTGLGFKNSNTEIDTNGNTNPGGWGDLVDNIYFEGLQGQGTTTLTRSAGDFTVNSNTQITIPSNKFPALSIGSYDIKLRKVMADVGPNIEGYAGDWRCDNDGRVTEGTRFTIYISDTYVTRAHREKKAPLILTDWNLKDKSGAAVNKYYSIDHVRCPDKIYKGNLIQMSAISRGVDDKSGLFRIADLTLDLANNDLEFSKLLAGTTILKNQIVKIYQAYPDEPYGWRSHVITMIIDDYNLNDEIFQVKLKDITQKYFRKKVPQYLCTSAEFSNIHPDKDGEVMPEALGNCSLTTGENKGAIEAVCIDTVTFKYLAARRALKSITQVYSNNVLKSTPADYSVSYDDEGRTYIIFTGDQGDYKVTFNCQGYSYGGLNTADGYIRNPAYVVLYYLLVILGVPFDMIDLDSFEDLATKYDNMGEGETCKLILQKQRDPNEVLVELLAGAGITTRKDGKITIKKKDVSTFQTNNGTAAPIIFRQYDVIGGSSRIYNMRDAINAINSRFNYFPTWELFGSAIKDENVNLIDDYGDVLDPEGHGFLEV